MKKYCLALACALTASNLFAAEIRLTSISPLNPVPTFESISLTANRNGDANGNAVGKVKYRKKGTTTWKLGYDMTKGWKNYFSSCIVHLTPGTEYEIQVAFSDPDGGVSATKKVNVKTWPQKFPEGKIITVNSQSTTLNVTQSGTPNHYAVYQPAPGQSATIDVGKKAKSCVAINADYVIVRGLTLKNAAQWGVVIARNHRNVVIDGCDISEFGPVSTPGSVKYYQASAVYLNEGETYESTRIIVQNCRIHDPSTGATSSSGPQAVTFVGTKANHVIRHNKIYSSSKDKWFKSAYGVAYHWSSNNTEIYGNEISQCFRGIFLGTFCENKRIWGNVFHDVHTALMHLSKHPTWDFRGPLYIWRNLFYNLRDNKGNPGILSHTKGPGRVRFYNNTLLNISGETNSIATGFKSTDGANFIVKNNIMDCGTPLTTDFKAAAARNTFNKNLYRQARGSIQLSASWEKNGFFSQSPAYDKEGNFSYYLKAGSPGIDAGEKIPNFCDAFAGKGPDLGACEKGVFSLNPGPQGASSPFVRTPGVQMMDPLVRVTRTGNQAIRFGFTGSENPGNIRVAVFNGLGRLVALVPCVPSSHGDRSALWNVRGYRSGVYFLQIETPSWSMSVKTMHVR